MRHIYKARAIQDKLGVIKKGSWVDGYYVEFLPYCPSAIATPESIKRDEEDTKHYIVREGFADYGMPREMEFIEVDPTTVSQCLGIRLPVYPEKLNHRGVLLKQYLFENDNVIIEGDQKGVVKWDRDLCAFAVFDENNNRISLICEDINIKILTNEN